MKKRLIRLGKSLLAVLAVAGVYFGVLQIDGNLHEVLPGELYRSAQLSPDQLSDAIHRYGIKSVINLRGENATAWYQRELAATEASGAKHFDFRMSAKRELPRDKADELLTLMRNAPKPMLIHCQAGADRTGLASALYITTEKNGSYAEAKLQLSPLYGHLPFAFADAYPMTKSFEKLQPALTSARTSHLD